ncbi:MAG: tetratricopeptide repeat protein [Candidatus Xenobia bacterium]
MRIRSAAFVLALLLARPALAQGQNGVVAPAVPPQATTEVVQEPIPLLAARSPAKQTSSEAQQLAAGLYNDAVKLVQQGKDERAIDTLQHAVELYPGLVKAHFALGTLLDARGQSLEALKEFQVGYAREPDHPKLVVNMGIACYRLGHLDDAEKWLKQGIGMDPKSPVGYNAMGLLLEREGKLDAARQSFQQALQVSPGFGAAHINLGLMALTAGHADQAEQELEAAGADNPDALNARGVLQWLSGHPDEASKLFGQALDRQRMHPAAAYNQALYLTSQGRYDEAHYYLEHLIETPGIASPALLLLGTVARLEGHLDEATKWLHRGLEQDPSSVLGHDELALVGLAENNLDLATLHLTNAIDLDPKDAVALNNLGVVMWRRGKTEDAIENVRRAAEADPNTAEYQFNLGHLLDLSGRGQMAIEPYKRYLDLAPKALDAADVRERISQLERRK